jgi:anaerobic selenocysteine-containing dehydrogenase
MQIFRYVEQGSIEFLWISATNPAVSMPELERIRAILGQESVFLVVQDLYLTETALYADVVLPAAGWGEKTGTFTNADRTVHLSDKAVEPPGEARSDLDIFLVYSARMNFSTKSGAPLLDWAGPQDGIRAWQDCSRGRPCDYTGITYTRLRGGSGIPWPCNDEHPDGTIRLHGDGVFATEPDNCETFGHDLLTGASVGEQAFRSLETHGRAFLKAAPYAPPHEEPDARRTSSTHALARVVLGSSTTRHRRRGWRSRCWMLAVSIFWRVTLYESPLVAVNLSFPPASAMCVRVRYLHRFITAIGI